jgi:hypothetical protein
MSLAPQMQTARLPSVMNTPYTERVLLRPLCCCFVFCVVNLTITDDAQQII